MFPCPICKTDLRRNYIHGGITFICDKCHGKMVAFTMLRKNFCCQDAINDLWRQAAQGGNTLLRCPYCQKQMKTITVQEGEDVFELDICMPCQQIWFDPGEMEKIPTEDIPEDPLAIVAARRNICNMSKYIPDSAEPDSAEETETNRNQLSSLRSFDPEESVSGFATIPFFTWTFVIAIIAIFTINQAWYPQLKADWSFIPVDCWRQHGLTFLTGPFFHYNIFHLGLGIYLLMVFSVNVELFLGKGKFLLLFIFSALAGEAAWLLTNAPSSSMLIGINTGMTGVVAFYAIMFPHAQIDWIYSRSRFSWRGPRIDTISAPAFLAVFAFVQFLCDYKFEKRNLVLADFYPLAGFIPGCVAAIICRIKNAVGLSN